MNGYLLSIIGVVLFSAVCTAILPEGKTTGLIKSIMRLACILAIVSPVLNFLSQGRISTFSDENLQTFFSQAGIASENTYIQYYCEMRVRETERALENEIKEKYALSAQVTLAWEEQRETVGEKYEFGRIRITKICVKLDDRSEEEVVRNMWEYVKETYCSEVVIE